MAGVGSKSGCAASGGGVTTGAGLALGGGAISGSKLGKPNKRGSILRVGKFVPPRAELAPSVLAKRAKTANKVNGAREFILIIGEGKGAKIA